MPFWLPNGTVLLRLIEREVREQLAKRGYEEIKTPRVLDEELWHRSGHWDNYRENMYFVEPSQREGDQRRFALKPMNCPGACLVFGSERHSYRELPLRLAEFGDVSRYEREGVLHGLLRVRAFTQDDGHVYCTLDQVADEVDSICAAIDELYARFGFDEVRVELSTRPEKSVGTDEQWERATRGLREALERQGREYDVSPGEGTFYGPKIDFHVTDALGRSWQLGTCQLDFQMPERFELTYQGEDNAEHRPVMIHRALLGLDGALRRDPDRALRRPLPGLAGAGAGGGAAGLRRAPRLRAPGRRRARRGRAAGARRRALGVGRAQDPRRRAGEAPVHGRRRRARAGRRHGSVRSHDRGDLGAVPVAEIPALIA